MARPRQFDRDDALVQAMEVFWAKGFAATSTDDLLQAMGIGRQSLYGSFGDKRRLYLEAMARYQQESVAGHLQRLRAQASPLAGIEAMLLGLIDEDPAVREKGCMGVGSVCEFGAADADLAALRASAGGLQHQALVERLEAAKAEGEVAASLDVEAAARLIIITMQGLQVAGKAGASAADLRAAASLAVEGLRQQ